MLSILTVAIDSLSVALTHQYLNSALLFYKIRNKNTSARRSNPTHGLTQPVTTLYPRALNDPVECHGRWPAAITASDDVTPNDE